MHKMVQSMMIAAIAVLAAVAMRADAQRRSSPSRLRRSETASPLRQPKTASLIRFCPEPIHLKFSTERAVLPLLVTGLFGFGLLRRMAQILAGEDIGRRIQETQKRAAYALVRLEAVSAD